MGLMLLAACGPDSASTDGNGSTSTTGTTSEPTTGAATATTTSATSHASTTHASTGEPEPAVCGDGVVDDGELCDDGNGEPDDGCDACAPAPAIAWTYTHNGPADKNDVAIGVAVDATGRIVAVGGETAGTRDALVIALSPDGKELWRRAIDGLAGRNDGFYDVVLDDAGRIYVAGYEEVAPEDRTAIVRAFDPDGGDLWRFAEAPADPGYAVVEDLALADGALYSVGAEGLKPSGAQLVARRHDLATGEAVWRTVTQAGWAHAYAGGVTATAERLVVVGYVQDNTVIQPLTVVLAPDGAIVSTAIQEIPWGFWYDVVPIGDAGDLLFVGRTFMPGLLDRDVIVRRVDAGFTERWTQIYEHEILEDMGNGVAVGANESVFVAGSVTSASRTEDHYDIFAGRYAGDGTPLWIDIYDHPEAHRDDFGNAAAAGPGFFVLAGYETTPDRGTDLWVRRFEDG